MPTKENIDKFYRYIDVYVPINTCTLNCSYCYIGNGQGFHNIKPSFVADPKTFRKALSKKRLGGTCLFSFCAAGETLLCKELTQYVEELILEGHYVEIVSNGTVSSAFVPYISLPIDVREKLSFKFSYHYIELKKRNLLAHFFSNINTVRHAGISFSLEMTTDDNAVPLIDEIIEITRTHLGANCHIAVARNQNSRSTMPMETHMRLSDYANTWGKFESPSFTLQLEQWGKRQKHFCYAGDWMLFLDMGTGLVRQCCLSTWFSENIFENIDKPIHFRPIGRHCREPHCYNSQQWISMGMVPDEKAPSYAEIRDRTTTEDTQWLSPKISAFFSQKIEENHNRSLIKEIISDMRIDVFRVRRKILRTFQKKHKR